VPASGILLAGGPRGRTFAVGGSLLGPDDGHRLRYSILSALGEAVDREFDHVCRPFELDRGCCVGVLPAVAAAAGSCPEVSRSGRSAETVTDRHELVHADRLVLPDLPLGAPELLGDLGEGGIEGRVDVTVAALGALRRKAVHPDDDAAAVGRAVPAEMGGGSAQASDVLGRHPLDALPRMVGKPVAEIDVRALDGNAPVDVLSLQVLLRTDQ
jgi:hypothetical protein